MSFKHIDKLKKVNLDIPFKSPDYVKEYNKIYPSCSTISTLTRLVNFNEYL